GANASGEPLVALIEEYFASVDRNDIPSTLATMTADCVLEYRTHGKVYVGRDTGIRDYFVDRNATVVQSWHGNTVHTVDVPNARVATRFDLRRTDRGAPEQSGDNLNLFQFEGARIKRISVWGGLAR
ncbi:MAG: nuclear transport factor 2 family protein, partial [Burkholderiales bacterium]